MSLSDGATQYVPLDKLKIYQDSILVNSLLRKLNFSNRFNIIENPGADTVDIDVGDEIQNLTDLIDVAITQPIEKHVLRYSGSQWENKQLKITDLEDVQITGSSPLQGHSLRHDGTNWVNAFPFLDDLIDVTISNPVSSHTLRHNGISWVNALPLLQDNLDVSLTSPSPVTGDVLRFNGTHWVNVVASAINLAINDLTDVIITSAQTGQFLRFDGSDWTNTLLSLNNLTDVVLGSLQTGQFIQYNGTNWVNTLAILDTFTDVIITSPSNGQVLQYNGTHWINATPTPGVVGLNDLGDVVLTSPANGDILRHNGTSWINLALAELIALTQLSDVNITSPINGQVLKYNGAIWINDTAAAGGAADLDDLTDVTLNTPINNQALIYDSSTNQWRNQGLPSAPVNLNDLNDVSLSGLAAGHILRHNGSVFTNVLLAELIALTQLSDVTVTSPTTNQQLVYNASTSTWTNQTVAQASSVSFLPDTVNNGSNWGIWTGGARAGTGLFADCMLLGTAGSRQASTTGGKAVTEFISGSSSGNVCGFRGATTNSVGFYVRRDQNFHMKMRLQIPTTSSFRLSAGLAAIDQLPGSETVLASGVAGFIFFFSSGVTSNIEIRRNDTSGSSVNVSTGTSIATNTPVTLEMIAEASNNRIGWRVNEGPTTFYTAEIPPATTSLNYHVRVETKTGSARFLQLYYAYLTQDPS